jgi:hypothetical protein
MHLEVNEVKDIKTMHFLKYVTLQKTLADVMKPYYLKTKETQPLVGIITVCSLDLPTIEYQL